MRLQIGKVTQPKADLEVLRDIGVRLGGGNERYPPKVRSNSVYWT